jgi:hypothetical protein
VSPEKSGRLESYEDAVHFWRSSRELREDLPDGMFEKLKEAIHAYHAALTPKIEPISEDALEEARKDLIEGMNEILEEYGFSW